MRPDIKAKLRKELVEPIESERQVVYILVEIRKLIEQAGKRDVYPSIRFHCDWIVHHELRGPDAQAIVKEVDKYEREFDAIDEAPNEVFELPTVWDMEFQGTIVERIQLTAFRRELKTYLQSEGLDVAFIDDKNQWGNFLNYYARVVEDCPLRCVSSGLANVDEVVLKVKSLIPLEQRIGYKLAIEWTWKSKITGQVSVKPQRY